MSLWGDITHAASSVVHDAESVVKTGENVVKDAANKLSSEAQDVFKFGSKFVKDVAKDAEVVGHQAMLFGEGVVTGAILNPINGVEQLVNHVGGFHLPPLEFSNQEEVDKSWAGRIGAVAGTAVDFIATDGAVSGLAGIEAGSALSLGITGAVEGGILTPTSSKAGGNFLLDRLESAGIDGATFAVTGGVAGALSGAAGDAATASLTGRVVTNGLSTAVGGGAGGVVSAEATSLINQGKFASESDLVHQVSTNALLGGLIGAGGTAFAGARGAFDQPVTTDGPTASPDIPQPGRIYDAPPPSGTPSETAPESLDQPPTGQTGTPREAYVEGEGDNPIRTYHIGDNTYRLQRAGGFYYPTDDGILRYGEEGSTDAPIKVHVNADSAESLREAQQALIPALEKDPELRELVGTWKTIDPARGFGDGAGLGTGQSAKGFTLYTGTNADAVQVAQRVDQILADNQLAVAEPIDTGNVDGIPDWSQSKRVGIVRDTFDRSVDSTAYQPVAALDPAVQTRIEDAFREQFPADQTGRLSADALRSVEQAAGLEPNTLVYDSDGRLSLLLSDGSQDAYHGGVYATEAGTSSEFGELTNRRALYSLYGQYGLEPAQVATDSAPEISTEQPPSATGETRGSGLPTDRQEASATTQAQEQLASQEAATGSNSNPLDFSRVDGEPIPFNQPISIGRGADAFIKVGDDNLTVSRQQAWLYADRNGQAYIADDGSSNGTFVNSERLPSKNPDGTVNWQLLKPTDKVSLGPDYNVTVFRPGQIA